MYRCWPAAIEARWAGVIVCDRLVLLRARCCSILAWDLARRRFDDAVVISIYRHKFL